MANDLKIVSWEGNNINDGTSYESKFTPGTEWGLPSVQANFVPRHGRWPLVSTISRPGARLRFNTKITDSASIRTLRDQLLGWFDPEAEVSGSLVIEDDDNTGDRYVRAICESITPFVASARAEQTLFHVVLAVDDDVRWRSTTSSSQLIEVTGSTGNATVTNSGKDDAYPVYTILASASKTGGAGVFYRWMPVRWNRDVAFNSYPIDVTGGSLDTATLISGSKLQASGDDLLTKIGDSEINRWFQGLNSASTHVWINLSFSARQEVTLAASMAAAGSPTSVVVNESIAGFPNEGYFMVDSEGFSYQSKSDASKTFSGVTRTIESTTAASHASSASLWWVQNNLRLHYGDTTLSATVDDDYKPAFDFASSCNLMWDYNEFGDDNAKRTATWSYDDGGGAVYNGNQGTSSSSWVEIGIKIDNESYPTYMRWKLYNPCEITAASFTGEKRSTLHANFSAGIEESSDGVSWSTAAGIGDPSGQGWEAWTSTPTIGEAYLGMWMQNRFADGEDDLEASDVRVALNSSFVPSITIGTEIATGYNLAATISNATTSASIVLTSALSIDDELEVDTDAKTIKNLTSGSTSSFGALSFSGSVRKDWLPLVSGSNDIHYAETGAASVDLTVRWTERYF
jgi:hypothetical protein